MYNENKGSHTINEVIYNGDYQENSPNYSNDA